MFTHDDVSIEITGVQVPTGSIAEGEAPQDAVAREVLEETELCARVVCALGVEHYDMWPAKSQIHERHFFQLELVDDDIPERWQAGEDDPSDDPSDDGAPVRWTCWWTPMGNSHVLCAGLGAALGRVELGDER